jgi:hypothetical protein
MHALLHESIVGEERPINAGPSDSLTRKHEAVSVLRNPKVCPFHQRSGESKKQKDDIGHKLRRFATMLDK